MLGPLALLGALLAPAPSAAAPPAAVLETMPDGPAPWAREQRFRTELANRPIRVTVTGLAKGIQGLPDQLTFLDTTHELALLVSLPPGIPLPVLVGDTVTIVVGDRPWTAPWDTVTTLRAPTRARSAGSDDAPSTRADARCPPQG